MPGREDMATITARHLGALLTALIAVLFIYGCEGPARERAFSATPRRTATPAKPTPAATKPAPATDKSTQPPPNRRPATIGSDAMRHFKNGMAAAGQSPEEAIKHFNLALGAEPNFTEARYDLAMMMLRLGNNAGARAELTEAAKTEFRSADVYSALGLICAAEKNYDCAAKSLAAAASKEPSNPGHIVNLGAIHSLNGNSALAIKTYAEAEAKAPYTRYLDYNTGTAHLMDKEYQKAAERFKKSMATKDAVPEAAIAYAAILLKDGNYREAEAIYLDVVKLNSELATPHVNLGIIYELYLNDYDKAAEHYSRYIALGGKRAKEAQGWLEIIKEKAASEKQASPQP